MSMKKERGENKDSRSIKKLLVIGDWVVDEHWVTGIHRSPTASRTGRVHYRALHSPDSTVQAFCGAGRTATILHRSRSDSKRVCDAVGVGLWHPDDTAVLADMLDPAANKHQTPHRITRIDTATEDKAKLFNLADVLAEAHHSGSRDDVYGTTRVMRVYQNTGDGIELLHRIDWELVPRNRDVWIDDEKILENSELDGYLSQEAGKIDAVVVKDICKGVISAALIRWLVGKLRKEVAWFVSTKAWNPDWLAELQDADVRLLLIPQVAAQGAERRGHLSRWITRSGHASKEALEEIDKFDEKFNRSPRLTIVALPDGLSLLARDWLRSDETKKRVGIVQTDVRPRPLAQDVSMASIFFPALVANLIKNDNISLASLMKAALHFTQGWMSFEVGRLEKPQDWDPIEEPVLKPGSRDESGSLGTWRDFKWEQAKDKWTQALSSYGIISGDGEKCLELWRAMTEVHDYACCIKSKRDILQSLVKEIANFKNGDRSRHQSFMLIASPGSGKTFLASRLAKSVGLRFLSFNITQMLSRSDVIDCFDTIVTSQAQNRDEPILVFVDEINASLGTQHVYDAFLSPVEGGGYVRGGKTFHIDPCVWVFAGTAFPAPARISEQREDPDDKSSDFRSRLTLDPLDFRIDPREKISDAETIEARVEKVYLGVSLLRSAFRDVTKVSEKVLKAFHILPHSLPVRELERFVKGFVDIQYGAVVAKNVPTRWFKEIEIDLETWQSGEEGELVDIKGYETIA